MPSLRIPVLSIILTVVIALPIKAADPLSNLLIRFKREIPVLLFEGQTGTIGARGEAVLECYRGFKLSEIYYFSDTVDLLSLENGLEITNSDGTIAIGLTEIRCKPKLETSTVTFNGHAYRGYFQIIYQDSPGLIIINKVDIEDYLKGVLPGEIGDRSPEEYEAVKAQAIAARTYAVWKLTENHASRHLSPTVADQLYTGIDSEKDLLTKGVEETNGEIMIFKGRPIAAFYHAVCGGHTAPIQNAWPDKHPTPYLESADDGDYCRWAKSYYWNEIFTLSRLKESLEKYFTGKGVAHAGEFDGMTDINFGSDPRTGRVVQMQITTSSGVYNEKCDRIRWALGRPSMPGAILPSTNFKIEKEMDGNKLAGLKIIGTGNGHGVGMCQCGAIGRSRAGFNCDEILKVYYRHTKLARLY